MALNHRVILSAAIVALAATAALAGGIEPGLWRITTRTATGGVIGPAHELSKCLTTEMAQDLATTFSPISRTENSVCAPIDRNLTDRKLTWHLVCKGQLNMDLSGEFNFDDPRHYTATIHTQAVMAGMTMIDSQDTLEARWVSACQ